jgi:dephospho-CoA kinase
VSINSFSNCSQNGCMEEKRLKMYDRERLRVMMIENASEINRLQRRVHEIVRSKDNELRKEWPQACKKFSAAWKIFLFQVDRTKGFSNGF